MANKLPKNVYFVPKAKGTIEFCTVEEALKDIEAGGFFTSDIALQMFQNGEVPFSETKYYAVKFEPLEEWEIKEEAKPEEPEAVLITSGDIVSKETNGVIKIGEVFVDDAGATQVRFYVNGKPKLQKLSTGKKGWSRLEDQTVALAEFESTKPTEVVAVVVEPLTLEEKTRFNEIESELDGLKQELEVNLPIKIGGLLLEIQQGQLHRETGKTFEEYVKDRFGYSRQYSTQLAQNAGFDQVVEPSRLLEGMKELSFKASTDLVRKGNALVESVGLEESGMDELKDILQASVELVGEVASQEGERSVVPRVIDATNQVIRDILAEEAVTIDGQQYKLSEAKEAGLLNPSVKNQVLELVAESLKTNRDYIISQSREALARQVAPVVGGGTSTAKVYYEEKIPKTQVKATCPIHKAQAFKSIGNGTFQLECGCRFRISTVTGDVAIFEVDGKAVKQ